MNNVFLKQWPTFLLQRVKKVSGFLLRNSFVLSFIYIKTHVLPISGSISPTCLHKTFTQLDLKSTKRQSSHLCLFKIFGSAGEESAYKMLLKLTPGVNFINILRAAFTIYNCGSQKRQMTLQTWLSFFCAFRIYVCKSCT